MFRNAEHIERSLSDVRENRSDREVVDIRDLRLIMLSDQHRGMKTGADDFLPCKDIYHRALEHYLGQDFRLLLLGDVEELWECRPGQVVDAYRDTLKLEAEFIDRGGYVRLFGNHDDEWAHPDRVWWHLRDFVPKKKPGRPSVLEAITLVVKDGDEVLGEIFITHGHQGTLDSDRIAKISRWLVRWFWRPVQRVLEIRSNSPSQDYSLRMGHEKNMYEWARKQEGMIIVTGHTHHAVFSSHSEVVYLEREMHQLEEEMEAAKTDDEKQCVQWEWNALKRRYEELMEEADGIVLELPENVRPCYYNTGCCSYSDGHLTGIEIVDGHIRLVRWPDREGKNQAEVIRSASLRRVFREVDD